MNTIVVREMFSDRKFLVTGGVIISILLLYAFFPESVGLAPVLQGIIALFLFFFLFPVLYCKIILKEPIFTLGFRFPEGVAGWFFVLFAVVLGIGGAFLLKIFFPEAMSDAAIPDTVRKSFGSFLRFELFSIVILFLYEVFFRGFVMLSWLSRFGRGSVVLQWVVFMLFLATTGTFGWDQARMILFAPLAGWIALSTRSIGFSFLAATLFFLITDIIILFSR